MDTAIDRAAAWLHQKLADGAKSANLIRTEAGAADHSAASLRRAKDRLGVKSERRDDEWFWLLPDQPQDAQALASAAQDAHEQDAQDEQGVQSPAAELQGAQAQGAHAPDVPAQDTQAIVGIGQDAHGQDAQGAQGAQDLPPKRNRVITIRRHGEASGPETKFIGNWLSQHWADRIVASWLEIGGDKAVTQIRFVRGDENQPQNKFDRDREPK